MNSESKFWPTDLLPIAAAFADLVGTRQDFS